MFYNNKSILINTLSLMIHHTNEIQLMENIKTAFDTVDTNKIVDVEIRTLVESIKIFSNDLYEKSIRFPKQAKMYFDSSSLPDEVKELVGESGSTLSSKVIEEFVTFYSKAKHAVSMSTAIDNLNDTWDKFSKSGLSGVDIKLTNLLSKLEVVQDLGKSLAQDTMKNNAFVYNAFEEETGVKSFGTNRVEQESIEEDFNLVSTGMWVDNLVGGGFRAGTLYVMGALPSNFKSGFMLNVAEYIALHHSWDDFIVPSGMIPAILYINLEMKPSSINKRRCAFHGVNYDTIRGYSDTDANVDKIGDSRQLTENMMAMLREKNSRIPIVFKTELEGYSNINIKTDIAEYERLGFKIIMLITDYLDLFQIDWGEYREAEREEPLTIKAKQQRKIGIDLRIPVLSGAQLNRGGEELTTKLNEAGSRDIVKILNAGMIAKAHALKQKLDGLWFCHKFSVQDRINGDFTKRNFLGIVVDKDREDQAKFVPSPHVEKKPDNNYTGGRGGDYRTYYVVELEGIRLSDKIYSDTIKDLVNANSVAIDIVSMEEDDLNDETREMPEHLREEEERRTNYKKHEEENEEE